MDFWYGAAESGDRVLRVFGSDVGAPEMELEERFSLVRALEIAAAVLPRGSALLVLSDFFDLTQDDELLVLLGRRLDCTALLARDPWFDGLPLGGFVRVGDAETAQTVSLFIGGRERAAYARAVRSREETLLQRLSRANWRTGTFDETGGGEALLRAFALR